MGDATCIELKRKDLLVSFRDKTLKIPSVKYRPLDTRYISPNVSRRLAVAYLGDREVLVFETNLCLKLSSGFDCSFFEESPQDFVTYGLYFDK